MTEDQVVTSLNNVNVQLASLTAATSALCRDITDIKVMMEKQGERVRILEVNRAANEIQMEGLQKCSEELKKDSASRNSVLWNMANSIGLAIASYLALRS